MGFLENYVDTNSKGARVYRLNAKEILIVDEQNEVFNSNRDAQEKLTSRWRNALKAKIILDTALLFVACYSVKEFVNQNPVDGVIGLAVGIVLFKIGNQVARKGINDKTLEEMVSSQTH